ncbi:MAG: hypothetical protein KDD78_15815, partial [Caldilineaceae bacterium]|nr:hypothetical protein [Caldilineaceae bacterium]
FECLHHVQAGTETAYALLLAMYPAGSMVNMAGLWMLIGYLDLLQQEGRVRMTQENGLWRYQPL